MTAKCGLKYDDQVSCCKEKINSFYNQLHKVTLDDVLS